jgi:GNAT superfamily N-acetyltransferase
MIRRATHDAEDVEALVMLRRAMWDESHPEAPSDDRFVAETRRYYAERAPHRLAWLAFVDGVAVGMTTLLVSEHPPRMTGRVHRGYVTAVFVAPAHRRRGVARALLAAVVAHARSERWQRLVLRTSEAGRRLYESAGFSLLEHLALVV